jgi:hypothetical protein
MTDRFSGLLVILDHDIRDDDAQPIVDAIKQMRGVCDVRGHIGGATVAIAEERARQDLVKQLWSVLHPKGAA